MNTIKFLKIGKIAGVHYTGVRKSNVIVVYGIGAPTVPDNGNLPEAEVVLEKGVDIFVPDYIGFGRSDGKFTPENCINTFILLHDAFKKGCWGLNHYDGSKVKLKYDRVIFVGRSLGGAYVPLLPKYNKEIKELGIFYPAADQSEQGKVAGEESNEDFMKGMKLDGYHHLYRGVLSKTWIEHLEDRDGLSPMDNIADLKNVKMFIAHGKKDKCINFTKSVNYFREIIKTFPDKKTQFKLKLYPKGDHGAATSKPAMRDFLDWILLK